MGQSEHKRVLCGSQTFRGNLQMQIWADVYTLGGLWALARVHGGDEFCACRTAVCFAGLGLSAHR